MQDAYGAADILVNNAGTCIHKPALEVTPQEWQQVFDVNVTGVWNCCQAFGRQISRQQPRSRPCDDRIAHHRHG